MKIQISTKRNSSIFLAFVLLAGTFAAISPSSFIIGVNAQSESYNYVMNDDKYNDYERDYGMDNYDKKSHEPKPRSYGNDREYYGMDNNYDKKSYGYEPKYPSYGKDDREKSKDSNKSININKIKCINTNLNINGNNAGNVSIGNKGQENLGAYSSNGGGYGIGEGYDNKQDKGFDCLINNNNNNTNIVTVGGGNVTVGGGNVTDGNGNGNETDACEDCFSVLDETQFNLLLAAVQVTSIGEYCDRLASTPNSPQETQAVMNALMQAGANAQQIDAILRCLVNLGLISAPVEICLDAVDNDFDGLIDCQDPDCAALPGCMPPGP